VKLTFNNERAAEDLAVFCSRVTFDDAYRRADGATEEKRRAMAYRILEALSDLRTCFDKEKA
jgi:hypothetical protein